MKPITIILAVTILSVIVVWFSWKPVTQTGFQETEEIAQEKAIVSDLDMEVAHSVPAPNANQSEQVLAEPEAYLAEQVVDFEAMRQRFGMPYDPMIVMGVGDFSDAEIDAYNELHIIPFNRAVDKVCTKEVNPYLPGEFATRCQTIRERLPHPYEEMELGQLRELARSDATAALIMGRRALDSNERVEWYLRASALSGKTGPLIALGERQYTGPLVKEGASRGSKDPTHLIMRLALETAAAKLGDPRANTVRWQHALEEVAGERYEEAKSKAEHLAVRMLNRMAQIQQEVTGSTQVREALDV